MFEVIFCRDLKKILKFWIRYVVEMLILRNGNLLTVLNASHPFAKTAKFLKPKQDGFNTITKYNRSDYREIPR